MTSTLGQLSLETALAKNEAHMDDGWLSAAVDAVRAVDVMLYARREGWIVATDRTARCRRPSRNATTVRVWRSLIGPEVDR